MKRSEMVEKLLQELYLYAEPKDDKEAMSVIIEAIEKLGMLPPPLPRSAKGKILNRCKWEPEDA